MPERIYKQAKEGELREGLTISLTLATQPTIPLHEVISGLPRQAIASVGGFLQYLASPLGTGWTMEELGVHLGAEDGFIDMKPIAVDPEEALRARDLVGFVVDVVAATNPQSIEDLSRRAEIARSALDLGVALYHSAEGNPDVAREALAVYGEAQNGLRMSGWYALSQGNVATASDFSIPAAPRLLTDARRKAHHRAELLALGTD